jgi:imidazoleglycerol-phosphate dehydratase
MRQSSVSRLTKETEISVALDLDGSGSADIATGVGFFDHMLTQIARHGHIDLTVKARGDTHIDDHHTVEDVGIALGQCFRKALGDKAGITRYADVAVPMDETLSRCAIDISGRPYLVFRTTFATAKIGTFDTQLVEEWFRAFAFNAAHRDVLRRQRSSHRRKLLQGAGAGAAPGRGHRPGRGRPRAVDQRCSRGLKGPPHDHLCRLCSAAPR